MSSAQTPSNARGIPAAPFVSRVEEYVASLGEVDGTLQKFQETIGKYKFMESNLLKRAGGLRAKIPDIQKTLDMVNFLEQQSGEEHETMFELNDTLYAKAAIPPTSIVHLWLGANVMLEYPIPEAQTLLREKLSAAKETLATCDEDLEFLREQVTTMEVNTARVYNWSVTQRRLASSEGQSK